MNATNALPDGALNPVADTPNGVPRSVWMALGYGFPSLLLLLSQLPRWQSIAEVSETMQVAAFILLGWFVVLLVQRRRNGENFSIQFVPIAPHYVQAMLQICVYAYWGWYWRPVYDHASLIVAQLALAYSLDMLLSLTRRKSWSLGFGPFPIILSTNLFLLFRPDWYYLQFAMVAVGIFGKEYIRWNRDGRNTHIFNPSALSLFVFSVLLIATGKTSWSFAEEIATTLNNPPHIYLEIFLLGLVVQYLFSVTLVTVMSVLALVGLNLVYTGTTGTFFFVDSNIPIAVFLGLHLLITDPATSPRTAIGKAIFGALYGAGVFTLYGLLDQLGQPTFYDKLLCVPILNLMVPWIDALARRIRRVPAGARTRYSEISPATNRAFMMVWVSVFAILYSTSFVGPGHRGNDVSFWRNACDSNLRNACQTLFNINRTNCRRGDAVACVQAGEVFVARPDVADRLEQGHLLSRGCDLGYVPSCDQFRSYVSDGGKAELDVACTDGDYASCFIAGLVDMFGIGKEVDGPAAVRSWEQACNARWARACSYLGDAYLLGKNVDADPDKAARYVGEACAIDYQPACTTLAEMYRRGHGVPQSKTRAEELLADACEDGWDAACKQLQ